MMFWFKRKKIIVDAFIASQSIHELFPIQKANQFYPNWWKSLPSSYKTKTTEYAPAVDYPTMKRCDGFISLYNNGFVIPLWADLAIETKQDDSWAYQSSDEMLKLSTHQRVEYGPEFIDKMHFKIVSPWVIKEKSGIDFMITNTWWNNVNTPITIPNGIVEYKYQNGSHINFFTERKTQSLLLESGMPMVQLVPLYDGEVDIRCHLVNQAEYDVMLKNNSYQNSFMGRYKKRKKILSSCPFHRG